MEASEQINEILAKWNPLEVPGGIALIEYQSYVNPLKKIIRDKDKVVKYLERVLQDKMGLSYNPDNLLHKSELISIADQLCEITL